ncbi:MAG: putative PLP-dependent aminotransferase [Flavobacteriales bacterium TMED235]|nr:MAG: putative PLP-dependent aminotransferase [Flavobacteriales bacterium TMED235]|tara:strand:+ start:763 stop:1677 length:915 start_codon:yes stop_codon:yes gene_type:complete
MSYKSYFLWPKIRLKASSFFGNCSLNKLEKLFGNMFPSGYPVICSSGRVALYIAIIESNLGRQDKIKLFPYASHCVINTISRLTTPISYEFKSLNEIIYHQWGITYMEKCNPIIEDSVDSLYEKKTPLFSSGANYEIWSLSKILGTSSGGILWCKNRSDAIRIKNKMKGKRNLLISWILRLLSLKYSIFYEFWEGTEYGYKGLSLLQRNEIYNSIKSWDKLVSDRKDKIKLLINKSIINEQNISGRFPSCLPILTNRNEDEIEKMGFSVGLRHYYDGVRLIKVFPLPIHQDVSISFLKNVLKKI